MSIDRVVGREDGVVEIHGSHLGPAFEVLFGARPVTFMVIGDSEIHAWPEALAHRPVMVITPKNKFTVGPTEETNA